MGCLKVQAYGHPYGDANPQKLRSLSKPVHIHIYIYTYIYASADASPVGISPLKEETKRSMNSYAIPWQKLYEKQQLRQPRTRVGQVWRDRRS